uniref:Ubiquitin-like domain-containing protein n=1 Tax=Tetradesmus obliquus TaxID=3088 RepID=A0A383W9N3_TETOB|eukprot:jgi/Sobl393_1/19501/SZX74161.1
MLSKPAIGLAVVAVGASVYVKYYGFPDLQQQPASVQAELERAASMRTGEPMVLILGYLLFFITAGAFMFESGQAVVCAIRRYRWKPAELPPLQPVSEADRAAAAAASSQADDQQQQPDKQQQQQQQARQQQPSPVDHDERRRRALEALQREHDEKAAAARELQKQQDAERAARRAAAAAAAAATAAAEAANERASATAANSHWERWEQAMVQQYGVDANGNSNAAAAAAAAAAPQAAAAAAAAAAVPALTQQQQADLDASRLVRQEQDEEFQASLAADAQKRKERENAALLKRLKAALAGALLPEAAAAATAAASTDGDNAASADNNADAAGSSTLAIRVRLPDGSNAVRQFAGVQSFADVLDWVYALPGMPLLLPGAWGLASSFPRRQLAAAAGLWAPAEKAASSTGNSGVNLSVNLAERGVEECIEAGSSLGIAGRQRGEGGEAGYEAAPADAMSLCIRPLVGEAVTVQVLQRSSILEVKRQVEQQTGLVPEDQRLIFAGQVLDDAQTLQHYKISAQHTLQLAPRAGASIRTGSSSGGGAPEAAAAAVEPPTAAAAAAAAEEDGEASGLLVVSTVAQLREDVAHGASQLALYVVES